MNCARVEKALTEDLRCASRPEVKAHLQGCDACSSLYRDLSAIQQLTPCLARKTVEIPSEFSARIHQRLLSGKAFSPFFKPVLCMGLISLLTLGVASIWSPPSETGPKLASQQVGNNEEQLKQPPVIRELGTDSGKRTPNAGIGKVSRPGRHPRLPSQITVRSTVLHDDFYLNHASY